MIVLERYLFFCGWCRAKARPASHSHGVARRRSPGGALRIVAVRCFDAGGCKATTLLMVNAGPLGWLYARTLAFPLGAILMWPGSRAAFLPQQIPERYVRRTAAMLVLRPPSLMANWADVGFLDSFLERQIERYRGLTVPTIVLAGDRDLMLPPASRAESCSRSAERNANGAARFGHMLHHAAPDRVVAAVEEIAASSASF